MNLSDRFRIVMGIWRAVYGLIRVINLDILRSLTRQHVWRVRRKNAVCFYAQARYKSDLISNWLLKLQFELFRHIGAVKHSTIQLQKAHPKIQSQPKPSTTVNSKDILSFSPDDSTCTDRQQVPRALSLCPDADISVQGCFNSTEGAITCKTEVFTRLSSLPESRRQFPTK